MGIKFMDNLDRLWVLCLTWLPGNIAQKVAPRIISLPAVNTLQHPGNHSQHPNNSHNLATLWQPPTAPRIATDIATTWQQGKIAA